jgi:DNA (cytosine-5)-methyltransferase 1
MRSLEIFSGAGGLALGMKLAGFDHSALVEWNKDAYLTLKKNFSNIDLYNCDIRDFDYSKYREVDVISGGPPCQPFSLGGKHQGNLDDRDMFPLAIEGIRSIKPKAFIFENVKGLLRKSFSEYFDYILLQLTYPFLEKLKNERWENHLNRLRKIRIDKKYKEEEYSVEYKLVNAANYGVPQKRERVIIVGIKKSLGIEWNFPEETHSKDRLLWDKYITGEYWEKLEVPKADRLALSSKEEKIVIKLREKYGFFEPTLKPWVTVRKALFDLPDPELTISANSDHLYRAGAKIYPGHTGSFIDEPSKTIKAGGHGVPGGENMIRFSDGSVRYFTILEAKRIQTFPDNYYISGAWSESMRQLGNAVPVNLAYKFSERLFKKIRQPTMAI